jgi:hypothetical protein
MIYFFAVALVAGSLGYSVGAGLMLAILPNLTFIPWLVGIVVGTVFAFAVLALNFQKIVIIVATAMQGAAVIIGVFLFMFGKLPPPELTANPVNAVLSDSPLWMILYIVIAILGIAGQMASTRRWEVQTYNRWDEHAVVA